VWRFILEIGLEFSLRDGRIPEVIVTLNQACPFEGRNGAKGLVGFLIEEDKDGYRLASAIVAWTPIIAGKVEGSLKIFVFRLIVGVDFLLKCVFALPKRSFFTASSTKAKTLSVYYGSQGNRFLDLSIWGNQAKSLNLT